MRIFCAVRHSKDPKFFYGGLWSGNFYPALKKLGHEILEPEVDLLPASRFMQVRDGFTPQELDCRARITQKILEGLKKEHRKKPIDLFLSYFYNAHFDPAGFDEIHKLGIPTVNFYCNSVYQFELVAAIAPKVQFSWFPEKDAAGKYIQAGANPVHVQMGAEPGVYFPVKTEMRKKEACFIGQKYADRDRLLAALIRQNIPVAVYGTGWSGSFQTPGSSSNAEPYLGRKQLSNATFESYMNVVLKNIKSSGLLAGIKRSLDQMAYKRESGRLAPLFKNSLKGYADNIPETFSGYEVILNFSHVWEDGRPGSRLIPHIRLRDFEAPMCRVCYLTGYSEELNDYYNIGQEIDAYRNQEELVDKTRFYLKNPAQAEKLREAGYQRAIRDHTWEKRFQELFRKIGLLT